MPKDKEFEPTKWDEKWSKMDYLERQGHMRQIGESLGVNVNDYRRDGRPGMVGRPGYKDMDDYEKDVQEAMRQDPRWNNYLEDQRQMGNKVAQRAGALNDSASVYNAFSLGKRDHRKAGNGGSFSSPNDFMGMQDRTETKYQDYIFDKYAAQRAEERSTDDDETNDNIVSVPNTPSDFWTNIVNDPEFDRYDEVTPYSNPSQQTQDSAVSFKNKYMTDLTEGLNVGERQTLNLKNAMNAIGAAESKQGHNNYMAKFKNEDDD